MSQHIELGVRIARKAGEIMREHFRKDVHIDWKSEDHTPVTVVDTSVNELLLKEIPLVLPDYAIYAEEKSLAKESRFAAVCDPLDGTFPFTHGIPTFAFSLAFTEDGDPFACIIYDPILDRMYTAEKGKGAYVNGARISVKEWPLKNPEERLSVAISWDYGQRDLSQVHASLQKYPAACFNLLSAVYMGMLVASGEIGGCIVPVKYPWDCAAIKLLVEEAGGKVTDLFGSEQRYDRTVDGFVAAHPSLHQILVGMIQKNVMK
ncbi:MAG: hypothetical protein A3B99_05290 [Candidatus Yanofskybacteria bacterium RIFCSPHIGHO2_02_FULL_44_12b]|nr:MAG: hypothetical protein A3B99_05290 [Candidatus Yanofskybacteria bacterium RIFCSPHIGHO2_02_FULL_44_12b]